MNRGNWRKVVIFATIAMILVFWIVLTFKTCAFQKVTSKKNELEKPLLLEASIDKVRAKPGDTVIVTVVVKTKKPLHPVKVNGILFEPTKGSKNIDLRIKNKDYDIYEGKIKLSQDASEGLYAITVYATGGPYKEICKASFLVDKVIGDFLIISTFPRENAEEDVTHYMKNFFSLGGNMLIIHAIISENAWYPSKICKSTAISDSSDDRVGLALKLADKFGLPTLVSVSWDMTQKMPYSRYMESTKSIIKELWELYGHYPSLLGFYNYQEGSGTYLASQVREFCDTVKAQNKGLLTACAPYIDDPLLAGYLAAIESLDIIIYQGAVMASYRSDNRKCFPLRRTKDFTSLSSGGTLIRNKITLSHVELFGYMEKSFTNKYLASYENIYGQILSAATCYGPDGIMLFTYHHNIHNQSKKTPEAKESGLGVRDGLQAYELISKNVATESSHVALYIPYSDWCSDRWTNCFVPALDSFRRLGVMTEIIPFIPPKGEEILPYYPMSLNEDQLEYLLTNKFVLVLPDISGMQDTDSILIKKFVEKGGIAILFGPHIPYGDRFERAELCGGKEKTSARHYYIKVKEAVYTRVMKGMKFAFEPSDFLSWTPTTGKEIAIFEDGSTAVLMNGFGKGKVFTIPISIKDSVRIMPDLIRDILDYALAQRGVKRAFDIIGANEDMDLAMSFMNGEYRLAIVNYGKKPIDLKICPLNIASEKLYKLIDLRTGKIISQKSGKNFAEIKIRIRAIDFVAIKLSAK
ncbi:MAG: DUF4434 domain-containing protein [Acidobacteriota bacterium]